MRLLLALLALAGFAPAGSLQAAQPTSPTALAMQEPEGTEAAGSSRPLYACSPLDQDDLQRAEAVTRKGAMFNRSSFRCPHSWLSAEEDQGEFLRALGQKSLARFTQKPTDDRTLIHLRSVSSFEMTGSVTTIECNYREGIGYHYPTGGLATGFSVDPKIGKWIHKELKLSVADCRLVRALLVDLPYDEIPYEMPMGKELVIGGGLGWLTELVDEGGTWITFDRFPGVVFPDGKVGEAETMISTLLHYFASRTWESGKTLANPKRN